MGDSGWGIVFVLGIAGCVTVILTTVLWQIFQIARINAGTAHDGGHSDGGDSSHRPAAAE